MKQLFLVAAMMMMALSANAEFKMGYVDVQIVIKDSKAGKKAFEELKKEQEKKNKDLEKKKADIEKMREDIEKKRSVLSEEAFGKNFKKR
jgi:outer membrane protein